MAKKGKFCKGHKPKKGHPWIKGIYAEGGPKAIIIREKIRFLGPMNLPHRYHENNRGMSY